MGYVHISRSKGRTIEDFRAVSAKHNAPQDIDGLLKLGRDQLGDQRGGDVRGDLAQFEDVDRDGLAALGGQGGDALGGAVGQQPGRGRIAGAGADDGE